MRAAASSANGTPGKSGWRLAARRKRSNKLSVRHHARSRLARTEPLAARLEQGAKLDGDPIRRLEMNVVANAWSGGHRDVLEHG